MTVGCGEANNCWDKEIDGGGRVGRGASWYCDQVGETGPVGHETFGQQGNELARKILCRAMHADGLLENFNVLTNAQAHHFFRHSEPAFCADFLA